MSLQWTLIAGFLYIEIAIVLVLVLPVLSPRRWNTLFKSSFLQGIRRQAKIYFFILLAILVLFLLDAIREMKKYSHTDIDETHSHLDREMQGNMRLFRAQRNFYISGFALFLSLVIRRLVFLIMTEASLLAQTEASMRQAQSATTAAKSLLASQNSSSKNVEPSAPINYEEELNELRAENDKLSAQLLAERTDKNALKKQSENLEKEYDRLAEEHCKLQKATSGGGGENKKKD